MRLGIRQPPGEFRFQRLKLGQLPPHRLKMHAQLFVHLRARLVAVCAHAQDAGDLAEAESDMLGGPDELHALDTLGALRPVAARGAPMLQQAEVCPVAQGLDPFTGFGGQVSDGERRSLSGHAPSVASLWSGHRGMGCPAQADWK